MNQAAAGMQSAFGSMGQQVQKAAMSAAADAAAKEVTNQLSNALSGGGRRKSNKNLTYLKGRVAYEQPKRRKFLEQHLKRCAHVLMPPIPQWTFPMIAGHPK